MGSDGYAGYWVVRYTLIALIRGHTFGEMGMAGEGSKYKTISKWHNKVKSSISSITRWLQCLLKMPMV